MLSRKYISGGNTCLLDLSKYISLFSVSVISTKTCKIRLYRLCLTTDTIQISNRKTLF